jgi:DNA-binding PadR family transcriptional regulator
MQAPKGILRLVALKLLSQSSLSGAELQDQIVNETQSKWSLGPGSIYFMLSELRQKGFIVEVPRKEGVVRRYVISSRGREELHKLSGAASKDVRHQLELLSYFSSAAGDKALSEKLGILARELK